MTAGPYAITVVDPVALTDAMLIDCNVPETDYDAWDADTTYDQGDRVIVVSAHKVYESLVDGNTGNTPGADVLNWQEVGATNRWKPFDQSVSSQVKQADAISYQLRPGRAATALAALNLSGATAMRARVVAPVTGDVYDRTIDLSAHPLESGWWAWYFGERRSPTQAILTDLPSYPTADLYIDFTGTADLGVGVILFGQARRFSMGVKYGARLGIQDYSRKERNDFGDVMVVERNFAKRASFTLQLGADEVDSLHRFLSSVRARACLWMGSTRYESTTVYGFYKSFDIVISYFDYSDCDLELEGLT